MYKKAPMEECWKSTGSKPITVKWVDKQKRRSQPRMQESIGGEKKIKNDKREDLFVATPPLEAKKSLFSTAVTEGIGYVDGDMSP